MIDMKRYEFILRAAQPIAHHSETIGNMSVLMRESVRQPDGAFEEIPYITGDCIRHGLRETAAYLYLHAAGLLGEPSLSEAALRLLFAGGMITGSSGGAVKLDGYREMVDVFPPLALLGGCAQNRSIPGKMDVDRALLLCLETAGFVPEWVEEWAESEGGGLNSFRECVDEAQRTRMDPTLQPSKRALMSGGERRLIEARLDLHEKASEDEDAPAKAKAKSTMMPRSFEVVKRGSLFFWSVSAACDSELESDTLEYMLHAWLCRAVVGGKRATGHGLLTCAASSELRPSIPASTRAVVRLGDENVGRLFRAHVAERRDRAREFLAKVSA